MLLFCLFTIFTHMLFVVLLTQNAQCVYRLTIWVWVLVTREFSIQPV
jgi:hypothetical protein